MRKLPATIIYAALICACAGILEILALLARACWRNQ